MTLNIILADSDGDPEAEALRSILGYDVTHVEVSEEVEEVMARKEKPYHAVIIEPFRPRLVWTRDTHVARFVRQLSGMQIPVILYSGVGSGKIMAELELETRVDYANYIPRPLPPADFCRIVFETIEGYTKALETIRRVLR